MNEINNEIMKLFKSGALTPVFKEIYDANGRVLIAKFSAEDTSRCAVVFVCGESETDEIIAAIQEIEAEWNSENEISKIVLACTIALLITLSVVLFAVLTSSH